jgi:hypothetical protein
MRGGRRLLAALAVGLAAAGLAFTAPPPGEREVKPAPNVQDADDIKSPDSKVWVLDFKFKDPRVIKVNVPGRGQRVALYLWYQVTNNTKEPHTFIPDFELVTQDPRATHRDQVLPAVQEAIRQVEDPGNHLDIKNSVTIAAEPIPPAKPNTAPKPVTGVAIWLQAADAGGKADKDKDAVDPDANLYSIYVAGLSNGWAVSDPPEPGGKPVVRRKTLRLDFRRVGDRYYQKSEAIHFVKSEWVYRGQSLDVKGLPPKRPAPPAEPGGEK